MGSCSFKSKYSIDASVKIISSIKKQEKSPDTRTHITTFDKEYPSAFNHSFTGEGFLPLHSEDPFFEKPIIFKGDKKASEFFHMSKIGVSCRKGLKAGFNQDNFAIISKPPFLLAGVFDGHGENGHYMSSFARKILPKIILNDPFLSINPAQSILNSYAKTQLKISEKCTKQEIDCLNSGCTATLIVLYKDMLYISNLGDSRAILGKLYRNTIIAIPLTVDHKAENPVEKSRIERNGGFIKKIQGSDCERVYLNDNYECGLSVTRVFGDDSYQMIGVSCLPEITKKKIERNDKYVVICSDGV